MTKPIDLPKGKKWNKTKAKRKLDTLFSLFIRSKGVCEASDCGTGISCGGQLQCAHLISRWNLRLRWDKGNALSLCAGHHRYWTTAPLEWAKFLQDNYPSQYVYVMAHRNEKITFNEMFYKEKLLELGG